jgi:hypothetical protein
MCTHRPEPDDTLEELFREPPQPPAPAAGPPGAPAARRARPA